MSDNEENIKSSDNPDIEITPKDRLNILRTILYCGGIFYLVVTVALIVLRTVDGQPMSAELATLITFLGSTLTTIVGVIIGSSLNK